MELNWSTLILEIINFLALIWILKHFFYKPVLNVIARRRAGIEELLANAQQLHNEADTLKSEYENRLVEWEKERQQARETLDQELNEERARQMETLQTLLILEREKEQVAETRRRVKSARAIESKALQQSAQFATRLLSLAVGPELEERLFDLLVSHLSTFSVDKTTVLWGKKRKTPEGITIASAYPLTDRQRTTLEKTLIGLLEKTAPIEYQQDPALLAGLSITIGDWVLHANIRDELKGFTEFAYAAE
ncbi:F0F1 ATP synthase subunit delta [uncultured Desulfuromusa sp.]|uniref:F0F1 ATP synthase subunit delta n=1 Tax=uncultured Desulfuromusa sp. TaxID=219183 RepID=UPI002AA6AF1D|nr:F0F1 ATP synthase subunit delta [uncultured Desulfuromusa sp.]